MANRLFAHEQTLHDKVIESAKEQLDKLNHDVFTNPDGLKNMGVETSRGLLYPDLIITNKNVKKVKIIIEVETDSSINEFEAKQWKEYADYINAPFWLLVPHAKKDLTKTILHKCAISANVGTYMVIGNIVRISYE